ncbi:MAG: hypothetical protein Q9159_004328 [Coniocarpon cinnabarinum]
MHQLRWVLTAFSAFVILVRTESADKYEPRAFPNASSSLWPYQTFKSAPFNPPVLEIQTFDSQILSDGLILITPNNGSPENATKKTGPVIMTDKGELVWSGPDIVSANLRTADFENDTILTYWSGTATAQPNSGHGYGNVTFLDASYNEVLVVCPQFNLVTPDNIRYPCEADIHESHVTNRDTIIVSAYNATPTDLSVLDGGPKDGWVFDCLFYELDPRTREVLFRWSALEHVTVEATKYPLRGTGANQSIPFDYFHINSIVLLGDGYLVNSRHTFSVYLISPTGEIEWTLSGEDGGDFGTLPKNGQFAWQHHVRPRASTNTSLTITLFNNFNSEVSNGSSPSTGLELLLPLPPNSSVPVVHEDLFVADAPVFAETQGSLQILPNGNFFEDYGQISLVREWSSEGVLAWSGRFGADNLVQSYRGFKTEWHGRPASPPSLFVESTDSTSNTTGNRTVDAYVSWNGATDVTAWVVYEGSSGQELHRSNQVASIVDDEEGLRSPITYGVLDQNVGSEWWTFQFDN